MLNISNIFTKDINDFLSLKNSIENEYKGKETTRIETRKEYRNELESKQKSIKSSIEYKLIKVELYFVGVSFVILTGLVTNQLYTSSIIAMKSDILSWGSFLIGHIFVIVNFVLLILFARELTKVFFINETLNDKYLILPAILIPVFSQVNSAMISLTNGPYTQIGFSSIVVGILLVKFVLYDILGILKKLEPILSYVSPSVIYKENNIRLDEL